TELEHYRRVLATCHEHGLTPMVTFHHVTSPSWLTGDGGWEAEATPDRFGRFCERAMSYLGDLIPFACTINEPNLARVLAAVVSLAKDDAEPWWQDAARAAGGGDSSRFLPFLYASSPRARHTIMAAHRRCVDAVKSAAGECSVGVGIALTAFETAPGGDEAMERLRRSCEDEFLEDVGDVDYVGVQTYTRVRIGPEGTLLAEEGIERTQMGYEFYPEALEATIRRAVAVTGVPVIVTENGVATDDDTRRVEFVERALRGVERCLRDGIDVRGYFYWSAFDNFEWMLGYRPTFGLIAVDRETQERRVRPSARRLGEIARRNGL
ncbi:MAG TPA: family 1 glycosylhydrolase, partial [Gaiellaceae bacterium]|nr:family 1 glycosylhydrolase [Gaiellaceae bacterium]